MARKKTRKLVRAGLALAATTLAEAAVLKAAKNPRVRQKAKDIVRSAGRALKRSAKKLTGKGKRGRQMKSGGPVKSGRQVKSGRRRTATRRKKS
jgi:hypothetical protein